MTKSEIAKNKIKYWGYIRRARRIGFTIPERWLKYGDIPKDTSELIHTNLDSVVDKLENIFEIDDAFYKKMK